MVRGKGAESLHAQLAGKQYRDGINEVIRATAVRPSDLDQKALTLLDALQQHGRAQEACRYLKQALEGLSRDRVSNWRAYLYSLLRGFDEAAYESLKAERGEGRRRRGERGTARGHSGEESQAGTAPPTPSGTGDGGTVTGGRASGSGGLSETAAEFVPGQPWVGGGAVGAGTGASGPSRALPMLRCAAAEFVPGQVAWAGVDIGSGAAAVTSVGAPSRPATATAATATAGHAVATGGTTMPAPPALTVPRPVEAWAAAARPLLPEGGAGTLAPTERLGLHTNASRPAAVPARLAQASPAGPAAAEAVPPSSHHAAEVPQPSEAVAAAAAEPPRPSKPPPPAATPAPAAGVPRAAASQDAGCGVPAAAEPAHAAAVIAAEVPATASAAPEAPAAPAAPATASNARAEVVRAGAAVAAAAATASSVVEAEAGALSHDPDFRRALLGTCGVGDPLEASPGCAARAGHSAATLGSSGDRAALSAAECEALLRVASLRGLRQAEGYRAPARLVARDSWLAAFLWERVKDTVPVVRNGCRVIGLSNLLCIQYGDDGQQCLTEAALTLRLCLGGATAAAARGRASLCEAGATPARVACACAGCAALWADVRYGGRSWLATLQEAAGLGRSPVENRRRSAGLVALAAATALLVAPAITWARRRR